MAADCDARSYLNDISSDKSEWACAPCPFGGNCMGDDVTANSVYILDGWWMCPGELLRFEKCTLNPEACLGGRASRCAESRRNAPNETTLSSTTNTTTHTNRLCSSCAPGLVPVVISHQSQCGSCEPGVAPHFEALAYSLVLVAFFIMLVSIKLFRASVRTERKKGLLRTSAKSKSLKRMLITHIQMIFIVIGLNTPWPELITSPLGAVTETVSGALVGKALSCSVVTAETSVDGATILYASLLVGTMAPFVVSLISFGYWMFVAPRKVCFRCGHRRMIDSRNSFFVLGCAAAGPMIKRQHGDDEHRPYPYSTFDAWVFTSLLVVYLFLPRVLSLGFTVFQCDDICG